MSGPTAEGEIVHGTLVAKGRAGVLLRGASGAGKSDLALRLMGLGADWRLVSDDQVLLTRGSNRLVGKAPATIAGKLEVRGVGIMEVATTAAADICLIVDLVTRKAVPRMPEAGQSFDILGVRIPFRCLHGPDASSPLKIAMLLEVITKQQPAGKRGDLAKM